MIPTTTAPRPWSPAWDKGVVFMIRAGDPIERGELEAELAGHGAGIVYDFELAEAFIEGVTAFLADAPEDLARVLDIHAAELALEKGQTLPSDEAGLMDTACDTVRKHWPKYRLLIEQSARRQQLLPTIAFRRFCTGWSGTSPDAKMLPPFKRGIDGLVDMATVGDVNPLFVRLAGLHAFSLLWATGEEKNSGRLSQSDKSPRRSKDTSRKAGSSAKTTGRRTPGRRSTRTISPS